MNPRLNVVFLEDSTQDFELVSEQLRAEGFECNVERVDTPQSFSGALQGKSVDLILSDHALPGFDGNAALRMARELRPDVPFIFVSGAILEEQAIDTLKEGATDYVLKNRLARLGPAVRRALQESSELAERRKAEAALRESERQLRQIIDLVPHFIFAKDEDGRFLIANQAVAEALGTTVPNLLGKRDADFARSREESEKFRADDLEVLRMDSPKLIKQETISDAQGRVRLLQTVKIPFTPMGLEKRAVLGVSTDITELQRAEEERARAARQVEDLMEAIPDVLYLLDLEGRMVRWNRRAELVSGYSAQELQGMSAAQFFGAADVPRVVNAIQVAFATGFDEVEADLRRKDGTLVPYHFAGAPLRDARGHPIGLAGIGRDMTERRRAQQEMRLAATAFESHEGIFIIDKEGCILRVNRAFTEITGYSAEQAVGRSSSILNSDQHDSEFLSALWDALSATGRWQGEIYLRRRNGELCPVWQSITAVKGESGTVTHYVCHFQDISERKQVQARIEHMAYHDALTHLPNRSLLLDRLQQALVRNRRLGLHGALLFLDLDQFKNVNDSLGHPIGDLLLCEVAQRLQEQLRDDDTVARLGGDEFVILLAGLHSDHDRAIGDARVVADKIHNALLRDFNVAGYRLHVTVSIGVASFASGDENADDILRHADIAMYRAKAAGRNTVCFFAPDMQAAATERLELDGLLRRALENDEFSLHFQPQVEIGTGRILGAEGLMRWTHPQRGPLSPALFIPVLEESGLILAAGDWVLRTACGVASLLSRSHPELRVAVNVSARQLRQPGFADRVCRILAQSGTRPESIEIEITESAVIQDVEDTIRVLRALKDLGVHISLDDFGTGYSSLSYVKRLPLDTLKIDRAFVRDCTTNPNDAAIVRAIIAMAGSLDLNVVAEGVETEVQLKFLEEQGCRAYQGFHFSAAVPQEKFLALVGSGSPQTPAGN
jgi:diguanylate cyclase (GGDEF)-like protein/PAS domain S-box-containing protein